MKVLWITNTLFPDICNLLKIPIPVIGGWMHSSAAALLNSNKGIELAVATVYDGENFKEYFLNGITYFLLPAKGSKKKYCSYFENYWKSIHERYTPSIIHIHGTEYPVGLSYIRACGSKGVVISIQGLVSIYERYYYGGIDEKELRKNNTIRDYIRNDTIHRQRSDMKARGIFENEYLSTVKHVIGRTAWDKAHVWAINPEVHYHFCNETLREEFYKYEWNYENCDKHSVFLSQAHYPIKGLQQVIKALPIILKHFPDAKVYVAGEDFFTTKGWKINGFGNYIKNLIKSNNVTNRIIFTGLLNGENMVKRYLQSNVFVCPSAIENSPNSIGEAQLLGVPSVGSLVGGMLDMIDDNETGKLYRFEEIEMLASAICDIFSNRELACKLSENGRRAAINRHHKDKNSDALNDIYINICKNVLH